MNSMRKLEYRLYRACHIWNHLTNPAVFRTDREHRRCRRHARQVRRFIDRFAPRHSLREFSNGSLYIIV